MNINLPPSGKLRISEDYITVKLKFTKPLVCDVRKFENIHPRCGGKVYRAMFLRKGHVEFDTYCLETIKEWVNNYDRILILKAGKWTDLQQPKKPKRRGKK